jgi:hypothetical protein
VKLDVVAERAQEPGDVRRYLAGDVGFVVRTRYGDLLAEGSRFTDQVPISMRIPSHQS